MELRAFTEPQQGATFAQLLAVAQRAEQLGYSGFFRSDHYVHIGGEARPAVTDAWVTLGALAGQTSSIRLGTLMSSATFRLPGPLAVAAAQVDVMSGGRLEIGLGSGWYEREHQALGIPFPDLKERFDRFTEQLEILHGLWTTPEGSNFDYDGRYYQLEQCPVMFRPVQEPHPPILIGGYGARRTPALAARFAAEFNVPAATLGPTAEQYARVDAACEEIGRGSRLADPVGVGHGVHRPRRGRVHPAGGRDRARSRGDQRARPSRGSLGSQGHPRPLQGDRRQPRLSAVPRRGRPGSP